MTGALSALLECCGICICLVLMVVYVVSVNVIVTELIAGNLQMQVTY